MGRMRGLLWLTMGLIVAVLAGFVGFITLTRAAARRAGQEVAPPRVSVVIAARAVTVRSLLASADLALKELPVDAVPEGALREFGQVTGNLTLVDLYPGEIILVQRLLDPKVASASGRLALVVAEDQVLMAIPANDLLSRVGVLKPGDHVDLLFSLQVPTNRSSPLATAPTGGEGTGRMGATQEKEQATFDVLQNVIVGALVAGTTATGGSEARSPDAILLAVAPQDALVLKYVRDAGGIMDVVLRAPGTEQPFSTEPVDMDYLINRYRITTQMGR